MRKITEDSIDAFMNDKPFKRGNMEVYVDSNDNAILLLLHGNQIAKKPIDVPFDGNSIARKLADIPELEVCNGGWSSNTTKERLNGLPGVSIHQKDFVWYLNGKEWDGEWIAID